MVCIFISCSNLDTPDINTNTIIIIIINFTSITTYPIYKDEATNIALKVKFNALLLYYVVV